jgi:phosphoserine phosphatase RsbU/P
MTPNAAYRVLIVEDDPFFRRVLEKRLQIEGYQVQCAGDGREGMKSIVAFEPDLVVSDWMMPEVDGLELCQSVKTGLRESAPYFILLTAKGELSDKLLGLQTGADDYLVKPCDQAELMARVRSGLRIISLTKDLRRTVADLAAAQAAAAAPRAPEAGPSSPVVPTLAVCACCHRTRGEGGGWLDLETYLTQRRILDVSHGVCPECRSANYDQGKVA